MVAQAVQQASAGINPRVARSPGSPRVACGSLRSLSASSQARKSLKPTARKQALRSSRSPCLHTCNGRVAWSPRSPRVAFGPQRSPGADLQANVGLKPTACTRALCSSRSPCLHTCNAGVAWSPRSPRVAFGPQRSPGASLQACVKGTPAAASRAAYAALYKATLGSGQRAGVSGGQLVPAHDAAAQASALRQTRAPCAAQQAPPRSVGDKQPAPSLVQRSSFCLARTAARTRRRVRLRLGVAACAGKGAQE